MLTSYHTCYLEYTIDALKGSVILPNENEVEDNNYNYLHQTNNADIHLYNNYSDSEADEMVTWINKQVQIHIWPLNTTKEDSDYDNYRVPIVLIPTDTVTSAFKDTTQLVSNFICLLLQQHFKYHFTHMNHPLISYEYSTDTPLFSTKLTEVDWCAQLLCGKKYLLGDIYGMVTERKGGHKL